MKRFAQLAIGIATAAGCGGADAGTAPLAGLVGTLDLAAYNGAALPAYVFPNLGACSSMIVGGSLTTTTDGHVVFARSYVTPCTKNASPATETRTGVLSVEGTTITVALDADSFNPANVYTGTLAGGQVTLSDPTASTPQTYLLVRS
jgi:hypothetical protein